MRLLQRKGPNDYVFTEKFDDESKIPPYAILSHTWGAEEVTFQDFVGGGSEDKLGYEKIRFCGEQASRDGLQHFWIDTCCIDKTSYAELSHSIRSMFRWYEAAVRCYVFMTDVDTPSHKFAGEDHGWESKFRKSRWFTRGWTLQELLAPNSVGFFSKEGRFLGDKNSLAQQIHELTAIPHAAMQGKPLHLFSAEDRLHWKGNRVTTVPEDAAYSLSGLFSVSLAPVYGEGAESAYKRLNDEIRKTGECIRDLRDTDPRDDQKRIEDTKGGLLKDSYRWILNNVSFQQWQTDSSKPLLWIKGDPGKGKTMLLCGIINELRTSGTKALVSSFFCQATDDRINSGKLVLRGLLYLLVEQYPRLSYHVRKKYDGVRDRNMFEDANAWTVLTEIFSEVLQDSSLPITYIIVDALDECTTGMTMLLGFIIQQSPRYSRVKWLVSSRNWPEMQQKLELANHKVQLSLELNSKFVEAAVDSFIRQKVSWICSEKKLDDETRDVVLNDLTSKADSTFLWVSLVCQVLENTSARHIRKKLASIPQGLTALYERMLNLLHNSDDVEVCTRILAISTLVYRPLTVIELSALIEELHEGDADTTLELIGSCGSFLTMREGIVYFVHQSAKDFLLDKVVTGVYPSARQDAHAWIASRSFYLMSCDLHQDLYSLKDPGYHIAPGGTPPHDNDPLAASRYSCFYWADHLCESSQIDSVVVNLIETFLSQQCLYWFEALSLCGQLRKSISSLENIGSLIKPFDTLNTIHALCQDACRFIMHHLLIVETFPLQLYGSAIVFSPPTSHIRHCFQHVIKGWFSVKPSWKVNWSACLVTLEHYGSLVAISQSQDLLAVAGTSETKLIDMHSYTVLRTFQHLQARSPIAIAFSSHLNSLAAAWGTGSIKIWNTSNGACLIKKEGIIDEQLKFIAYSGTLIATASQSLLVGTRRYDQRTLGSLSRSISRRDTGTNPGIIRVWRITEKQELLMLQKTDTDDNVFSVAFSSDSKQLAFGSKNSIQIWDVSSGTCQKVIQAPASHIESIIFAPDSTLLASESVDTIRIWDVDKSTCVRTLTNQRARKKVIAFSPDSKLLASISRGFMIKTWNVNDGTCLKSFKDRSGLISSVAFSRSNRLVTASTRGTVKIWDINFESTETQVEGEYRSDGLHTMVFSHDSKWLAISSTDHGVEIWRTENGTRLVKLNQPRDNFTQATHIFWTSPTQLVVGLELDHVCIWNINKNGMTCSPTLRLFNERLTEMALSHDFTRLAVSSTQQMRWGHEVTQSSIQLYDLARERCIQAINCNHAITHLSFSSDDTWLYSDLGAMRTSPPHTLVQEHNAKPPSPEVESPQSFELVETLDDITMETWIVYKGKKLLWVPPEFRPARLSDEAGQKHWLVSPNGQIMAVFNEDRRLWFIKFDPSKRPDGV